MPEPVNAAILADPRPAGNACLSLFVCGLLCFGKVSGSFDAYSTDFALRLRAQRMLERVAFTHRSQRGYSETHLNAACKLAGFPLSVSIACRKRDLISHNPRTIVTVQGFIEAIFSILEDEDLTLGGKVARDLLRCLMNVVGNATCQKYLRETVALMQPRPPKS